MVTTQPRSFPRTRRQRKEPSRVKTFLLSTGLGVGLAVGGFFCLTSTLDRMTEIDCMAGVQKACQQLEASAKR